jgi:1,4-alpha-glucan branching enzyme
MEYTHVELMGILEHPYVPSWGYQVIGFFAPTSRLGTPTDFKHLVDAFHRAGIGVLLDMVVVHFPTDATGLAAYDNDSHLFECPIPDRKHTPWGTYYFDFARNEVKSFLISCLFHWVEEYYIDGFRFDAAGQFHHYEFSTEERYRAFLAAHGNCHNPEGFRFMQSMCYALKEEHPETLLIAEDSTIASGVTRPVEHGGHGFDFKWDLGCTSHMMKFFRAPSHQRGAVYNDLTYPMLYHHTENFLLPLCHDEVVHMKRSMVNKTEDLSDFEKFANLRLLYLLQFGYPQKKLLFMGQEFGQKSEWNAEEPLPWDSTWGRLHASLQWFVKRLNEVYRHVPAMHEGDNIPGGFEWIECQNARHQILAFLRYDRHYRDLLVYLVNLSREHFPEFRLGVPFAGRYHKVLDTDAQEFGGNGHHWVNGYETEPHPAFHHPHSFRTPLLPLHGMLFRFVTPR